MTTPHHLGTGGGEILTYEGYLKVRQLIALQQRRSEPAHHDELLFIIIHQAYELWFKLILWEVDGAVAAMAAGNARQATHFLRRVVEVEKLLVGQIHVLETMTPMDFLAFRERLNPASGFQSVQFRELEFASGLKSQRILDQFQGDPDVRARLQKRWESPSLAEAFRALLRGCGLDQPEGDSDAAVEARVKALAGLLQGSEEHRDLVELADVLVSHDEQIQLWRFHHVRMVERMIGFKKGTGGSEGVAYLESTIGRKFFPDLWAVRTHLQRV